MNQRIIFNNYNFPFDNNTNITNNNTNNSNPSNNPHNNSNNNSNNDSNNHGNLRLNKEWNKLNNNNLNDEKYYNYNNIYNNNNNGDGDDNDDESNDNISMDSFYLNNNNNNNKGHNKGHNNSNDNKKKKKNYSENTTAITSIVTNSTNKNKNNNNHKNIVKKVGNTHNTKNKVDFTEKINSNSSDVSVDDISINDDLWESNVKKSMKYLKQFKAIEDQNFESYFTPDGKRMVARKHIHFNIFPWFLSSELSNAKLRQTVEPSELFDALKFFWCGHLLEDDFPFIESYYMNNEPTSSNSLGAIITLKVEILKNRNLRKLQAKVDEHEERILELENTLLYQSNKQPKKRRQIQHPDSEQQSNGNNHINTIDLLENSDVILDSHNKRIKHLEEHLQTSDSIDCNTSFLDIIYPDSLDFAIPYVNTSFDDILNSNNNITNDEYLNPSMSLNPSFTSASSTELILGSNEEVTHLLKNLRFNINGRDANEVQKHLDSVISILQNYSHF